MISFTINDREVTGQEGWTILEVAKWHGIDIPTLCYHGAVEPYGACRLCVVEVDDGQQRRLVASCLHPVQEGLKVQTDSERVKNVRRWILQMMVDEHPGSQRIKELAKSYGVKESRFKSDRVEDLCILCGLCVRACDEVVGARAISLGNRGVRKEVATTHRLPSPECVACGTCLYVCPTGAMEQLFDRIRG
ncbi:MAG: 2Fe-2S iron-sulfur cluster-binding protein [Desulfobaccales bacterium]|nr:2Fe-2S iron-sulfur cluster-binding protein [Desulfobaccales bacterium]